MISISSVQEAIITLLKADAPLVDLVGTEIREENWMGVPASYQYPNVRVHVSRIAPVEESSNCDVYVCNFNLTYRALDESSLSCSQGTNVMIEAVKGKKLVHADFVSQTTVVLELVPGPIPESKNEWMSRVFFNDRLQEL